MQNPETYKNTESYETILDQAMDNGEICLQLGTYLLI